MNRLETLLSVYSGAMQRFENAAIQVLTQTGPSTAFGAGVDLLGRIAGLVRLGLSDNDFLRNIRAQIAAYHASGKREELNNIVLIMLYDVIGAGAYVHREGTATAIVEVTNVATPSVSTAQYLFTFLSDAVANGVALQLRYSLLPPVSTFTFDTGPGWDNGALSGAYST